jgi:EmrB/QacA subfamily drug resistance transporter
VAVCVAIFMLLLDITIVNVALPDIERSLGASFTELQWVIDAYALSLATFVLTAGSLADLVGRRRVFVLGVILFTAASILCGIATTPVFLILARAAQGIGGAAMFATSLALLSQEFHGRERGTAFGIWGATTGFAVAVGPLAGGILTDTLSWRWIFLVNIPVGIAAVVLTLLRVGESSDPEHGGVDLAGVLTFSGALFALVFALLRGNDLGWSSAWIVGLLVAGALLFAAFLVVESRSRKPMVDLTLFRKPAFAGAQIAAFALSASMFAMFLYLTLYLQNVLHYSPFGAGLRFMPISAVSFFAAAASGRLTARIPPRYLLGLGLGLTSLSLLLMHGLTTSSSWTALLLGFVIGGAGIGLTNPALASTAIGTVSPARAGMASGTNNTFRQVGIATGIAALGAVFQHHVKTSVTHALPEGGRYADAIASGGAAQALRAAPASARGQLAHAATAAFVSGLNELFLIGAGVAATGAVLAVVLVRQRDFVAWDRGAADAAAGRH